MMTTMALTWRKAMPMDAYRAKRQTWYEAAYSQANRITI